MAFRVKVAERWRVSFDLGFFNRYPVVCWEHAEYKDTLMNKISELNPKDS